MKIILGGGIAGLLLANKLDDSVVVESQPRIGGVFSYEEILDLKIPYHPPLSAYSCENFKADLVRLRIYSKKESYLPNKLGVEELPKWLIFNDGMYYFTDLVEYLDKLSKKAKIIFGNVKRLFPDKRILTTKGVVKADEIYVTISRRYISELLGYNTQLSSISFEELIVITNKKNLEWDVYVNGDSGFSFSHIINAYWISQNYTILYILIPFTTSPPIWDKVFSDLKRERIVTKDDILGYRSRIIRDGILLGTDENEYPSYLKFYGRLGKWKNFTLCETVQDILQS